MAKSEHPRPVAKVRAGVWPKAAYGTTFIDVSDPVTGASCCIELEHSPLGSLKVQMHNPIGAVHLCSPVQCVWSSAKPDDVAALARSKFYHTYGRYPREGEAI